MVKEYKLGNIGLKEKVILLFFQIVLPFVLYLAINLGSLVLGIGAGALLVFSMLVLVVFG